MNVLLLSQLHLSTARLELLHRREISFCTNKLTFQSNTEELPPTVQPTGILLVWVSVSVS